MPSSSADSAEISAALLDQRSDEARPLRFVRDFARTLDYISIFGQFDVWNTRTHLINAAKHRGRRGAWLARRDDREYREYLREEQRSQAGCIAGRMPAYL